ncbi:MAG TPA: phosphate ABC transporter permease PstA [Armatimonadota bacterium]|nr:phosphate ABC transporter permease PstA [Armatimonadota bacterium]
MSRRQSLSRSRAREARRAAANGLMWAFAALATIAALVPLGMVLYYIVIQGLPALNLAFFTHLARPVGEPGGGMANAIVGTLILIGLASAVGLPVGILGGIYLAEFGNHRFGAGVRFAADVLAGVPSIVVGILVWVIVVVPMQGFSALAGGLALGIMMIPTVIRTTEELVRLVPVSQREAALSLGATHWRTVFKVVLVAARGGVITGVLLAVARIAGETAPLLFTAFGNRFWSARLDQPIASLPVQIYYYAIAPYDDWHAQAWAGALVLVLIILILSAAARYATRGRLRAIR